MTTGDLRMQAFAYPIYLDLEILRAWIGTTQDGLSVAAERLTRSEFTSNDGSSAEGGISVGLDAIAKVKAGGAAERASTTGDVEELRETVSRSHAALFSTFLEDIQSAPRFTQLQTAADLRHDLLPGDIVQFNGEFRGNPAEEVVRALGTVVRMLEVQREAKRDALQTLSQDLRGQRSGAKKSGNPAHKDASGVGEKLKIVEEALQEMSVEDIDNSDSALGKALFQHAADELKTSGVRDIVMRCGVASEERFSAVMPLRSEYFSETVNGQLRDGRFDAIGKVTRVLRGDERLNVARRSVLGLLPGSQLAELVDDMTSEIDLGVDADDIDVVAPAVQILPLAIWV